MKLKVSSNNCLINSIPEKPLSFMELKEILFEFKILWKVRLFWNYMFDKICEAWVWWTCMPFQLSHKLICAVTDFWQSLIVVNFYWGLPYYCPFNLYCYYFPTSYITHTCCIYGATLLQVSNVKKRQVTAICK